MAQLWNPKSANFLRRRGAHSRSLRFGAAVAIRRPLDLHVTLGTEVSGRWTVEHATLVLRIVLSLCILALLGFFYLSEYNQGVQIAHSLMDLHTEEQLLLQRNGVLKTDIEQGASLQRIQQEATQLGLIPVDPRTIQYIQIPAPVNTVSRSAS
ncbi:MAG: hypothetical protein M1396_05055 [Chloroflexi bacterium]|nr:hypothetical protein [Chloroflexota bacterium]